MTNDIKQYPTASFHLGARFEVRMREGIENIVEIMKDATDSQTKYCIVNLTYSIVCRERFDTIADAVDFIFNTYHYVNEYN